MERLKQIESSVLSACRDWDQFSEQSNTVDMRTLCQIRDTCPELNQILFSLLAGLPLKMRS